MRGRRYRQRPIVATRNEVELPARLTRAATIAERVSPRYAMARRPDAGNTSWPTRSARQAKRGPLTKNSGRSATAGKLQCGAEPIAGSRRRPVIGEIRPAIADNFAQLLPHALLGTQATGSREKPTC